MDDIKIGDWITQYSKGYYKVLDIKDGYASSNYSYGNVSYKKGDLIGKWIICKKAFTPKMKPSICADFVSGIWCKKVDKNVLEEIEAYFKTHEDYKVKFENKVCALNGEITSEWMNIPDEKVDGFNAAVKKLPAKFTKYDLKNVLSDYEQYICNPPANYIFQLFSYPWELDNEFNKIYFKAELTKIR